MHFYISILLYQQNSNKKRYVNDIFELSPMYCKKLNAYNFRPSTPIFDLLEHKYQDKWLQDRRKMEMSKRQEETKVWKC